MGKGRGGAIMHKFFPESWFFLHLSANSFKVNLCFEDFLGAVIGRSAEGDMAFDKVKVDVEFWNAEGVGGCILKAV